MSFFDFNSIHWRGGIEAQRPAYPPSNHAGWISYDTGNAYVAYNAPPRLQWRLLGDSFELPVPDTTPLVHAVADDTALVGFDAGAVATATQRNIVMPDADVLLRKNNYAATVAPAVTDDASAGYAIGSVWIDTVTGRVYKCVDASTGAAVWTWLNEPASLPDSITEVPITTLGSSQSTINIPDIPGGFYALQLLVEARTDRGATNDGLVVHFNGDTAANYSYHSSNLSGAGTVGGNEAYSTATPILTFSLPANSSPANYLGRVEIVVQGYTNTTNPRMARLYGGNPLANSAGNLRETLGTIHWLNTANAIDRITLAPQVGTNFVAGSRYTLRLFGRLP